MALDQIGVDEPGDARQLRDVNHADGDCVAMAPAVILVAFDGVAEGVAVVERLAQPGLLQVLRHHVRLDADGALDELRQGAVDVEARGRVGLVEVQDRGVGDETGLDDFGGTGDELRVRQGAQEVEVHEDARRLVERADQVLARGGVDAGLAADGRVDHGQQRGGHLVDLDAAHPRRRDVAAEVGGRPATDGDHGIGAAHAALAQDVPAAAGGLQRLAVLGVLDLEGEGVDALGGQRFGDAVGGAGDAALVDHADVGRLARGLGDLGDEAGADAHLIGGGSVDGDAGHGSRGPFGARGGWWGRTRSSLAGTGPDQGRIRSGSGTIRIAQSCSQSPSAESR